MTDKKDENLDVADQAKKDAAQDNELTVEQMKEKYDLSSQEAIRQKNINKALVSSAKEPASLLEVDEKIAQSVLDQMYDGISLEEYKAKFGLNSPEESKDNVDEIVEQKILEREIKSKVDHIKSQIPEQYRETFDAEFAELTEGKKLSSETVDKYIKSAVRLSIPDDNHDEDAIKAMAVGNSVGGGATKQSDSKTSKAIEYSNKLLKEQGVL